MALPKTPQMFELTEAGQSPWLDNLSRELLRSGRLREWIERRGLLGVTSNPSIFQKAISTPGAGYEEDIQKFLRQGKSTLAIYDALTLADIRETCDLFRPVYERTQGEHGFVSLEVLPSLAYDREGTISEARRLFRAVARPNVMIKVPATPEGVAAVRDLIGEGVNINITLMFSAGHYRDVAAAYLSGLERYLKKGGDLGHVHSVASVFVSRVDTLVDKRLQSPEAENLKGKAAVANAKLIYQEFKKVLDSPRFRRLRKKGAHIQKVLWGSTSTKHPGYSDLLYVENLVGPETVNTMPQQTLEALWDHGLIRPGTIEEGVEEARSLAAELKAHGIDLLEVGEILQAEGVKAFSDSFDLLMKELEKARGRFAMKKEKGRRPVRATVSLPDPSLEGAVEKRLRELAAQNFRIRFFGGDPFLWKEEESHRKVISERLGWMRVHDWMMGRLFELDRLRDQIRREKVRDVVLLGMGGSSLAAEVMYAISKRPAGAPRLRVLDTTDPTEIAKVGSSLNLKRSLFIVSSKSGTTIETVSAAGYFYDRVRRAYGRGRDPERSGRHFVAITDEGSPLAKLGREKSFRAVFLNPSNVGGRFSALSFFGMLPAALVGVDVRRVLRGAREMFHAAEMEACPEKNTGIYLGTVLTECLRAGRDKLTLLDSHALAPFGAWLEQMIAESLGKEGRALVPVLGEPLRAPSEYGRDRFFVSMRLKGERRSGAAAKVSALSKAGFPVIEMEWPGIAAVGEAFLLWELATAAAGALMGVNPFDELNVAESKENTARLLADPAAERRLWLSGGGPVKGPKDLKSIFGSLNRKGFLALLLYAERNEAVHRAVGRIRNLLEENLKIPVLIGFGPRYLHSTGQLFKGGPPTGAFIEFVARDRRDLKIPGRPYGFARLKKAQALGDLGAMRRRGLAVALVDLGPDAVRGLEKFRAGLFSFFKSTV